MKRSRQSFVSSDFAIAMANLSDVNHLVSTLLGVSRDRLLEMDLEDIILLLVDGDPARFAGYLSRTPALRESLESIPHFYHYLFKYCYANEYVLLCNEMTLAYTPHWSVLTDLYKRSSRKEVTRRRFSVFCQLFSFDARWCTEWTDSLVLNRGHAKLTLQTTGDDEPFHSLFSYTDHEALMGSFRRDRASAEEMARLYSLVCPFGCPNALYYTEKHHKLRLIALDLVKVLTVSSVELLKQTYPQDVTRHNPLLVEADTAKECLLLHSFIDEVSALTAANKKLFLACMPSGVVVDDDDSFEKTLALMCQTLNKLAPVFVYMNAEWLHKYIDERLRPMLRTERDGSYCRSCHLTVADLRPRFLNKLEWLITNEESLDDGVRHYENIEREAADTAMMEQLLQTQSQPPQFDARQNLLHSLTIFMKQEEMPLARDLYAKLMMTPDDERTPLAFWRANNGIQRPEKVQHIYKILFNQCTK